MATKVGPDNVEFGEQGSSPSTPATGRVVIWAGTDKKMYRKGDDGVEYQLGEAVIDAADVVYTPADTGDWTGSTDPGDVNDALDQIASRVQYIEDNPPIPSDSYTPADSSYWDATAPTTQASALDKLAKRTRSAYIVLSGGYQVLATDAGVDIDFSTATVIVNENIPVDFGSAPTVIGITHTGLYHYVLTVDFEVFTVPATPSITFSVYSDTPGVTVAKADSGNYVANSSNHILITTSGVSLESSTSTSITLHCYNNDAVNTVNMSWDLAIYKVGDSD